MKFGVIPGCAEGADPESMVPQRRGAMDSGFALAVRPGM